jgi:molybdopterin-containing oxidoreductase family membrane subunit
MKYFKLVLWLGIAVAIVFGVWGIYDRLTTGHENAAYGSYVVWGLWVAMYLFFVGLAAGAFLFATLDLLFNLPLFRGTGRLALTLALITLGAGLFHIWLDLGHLDRIWKVYLQGNLNSVMTQIVWGYTAFGVLIALALALSLNWIKAPAWLLRALMIVGIPLALFLSGAVGALLGVQAARPFWHVGLFPVQFPVFAIASSIALVLAVLGIFSHRTDAQFTQLILVLGIATVVLQIVKLYFLWADFSQSLYGNVPMNVAAVREVLFGQHWWAFWILQLGVGSLLPILILVTPALARQPVWAGTAGVMTLIGFAVARANIVFPALTVPEIEALAHAFSDARLQFTYFPSVMEWAVTVGIVGLATAAFLLAYDHLPFLKLKEVS